MDAGTQPLDSQFQFISNLLDQQDDVIVRLDELNAEIEDLIKQLADERKAELGTEDEADTNPLSSIELGMSMSDSSSSKRKAA